MKSIIMFVTYDTSEGSSGSLVRPQKMYQAFKNIGYDVFLISGNRKEKEEGFKQLKNENKQFEFCYVEPSTYPMQPYIDYQIINYIKKSNIPIGLFYRDAYWKFYGISDKSIYKNLELHLRYRIDLYYFKKVSDVMFFPSDEMASYFKFKQPKIALPPAADKNSFSLRKSIYDLNKIPKAIYVGGISDKYGTPLLLNSFFNLNKEKVKAKLLIVCRKNEYNENTELFHKYLKYDWLEVKHLIGNELIKEYQSISFGIIPRERDLYNDFAVPVKLFEYLSHHLPILSTDCTEIAKLVRKNKLGIIRGSNENSFVDGLNEMLKNYMEYVDNVVEYVKVEGFWEHRAEKVANLLLKNKKYIGGNPS